MLTGAPPPQTHCSAQAAGTTSFNPRTSPAGEVRPILQVRRLRLRFSPKAKSVLLPGQALETLAT